MSSELKCNICSSNYNSSDKKPRMLICGHNFCDCCLRKQENRLCSTCQISYDNLEDLPINYAIMALSENQEDTEEEDMCQVHKMPENCECSTHKKMICGVCGMIEHKECDIHFIGEKLSTKKRKFNQEKSEEMERTEEAIRNIIVKAAKNIIMNYRLEKETKEFEAKLKELKVELKEKESEIENEFERQRTIQEWRDVINSQNEKVKNSSIDSELEVNQQILVDFLVDFQRDIGEIPQANRIRADE